MNTYYVCYSTLASGTESLFNILVKSDKPMGLGLVNDIIAEITKDIELYGMRQAGARITIVNIMPF